jgi:protein O-GlcNAc transferase
VSKKRFSKGPPFQPGQSSPSISLAQNEFTAAMAFHQRGQLDVAEKMYRAILSAQPKHFDALHALGILLLQQGKPEKAERQMSLAAKINPRVAPLHNNRGNALLELQRFDEAIASYDKAISLQSNNAEAFYNRGNALASLRRLVEAVESYDKSISLNSTNAQVFNNRGNALAGLNRLEEARLSFERAVSLQPSYGRAFVNLGSTLANLGLIDDAVVSFNKAISIQPRDTGALLGLGNALIGLKKFPEAIGAYNRALELNPDLEFAQGDRLHTKMRICDWDNFEGDWQQLIAAVRKNTLAAAPFTLLSIPSTSADQLKSARHYLTEKVPATRNPLWRKERYDHDRIRVAYLSSDLRDHPIGYLTVGLFEQHDTSRFDIKAISLGLKNDTEVEQRIAKSSEFIHVGALADEQVAEILRGSEIDIAVDLNGLTQGARTAILARRPAPIQVNYLGYPGTMAAPYIDYIITDRLLIASDETENYAEKIIRLPDSYQVNDAKRRISGKTISREDAGLPNEGFVFCCFNNNFKITPEIFDLWVRLLEKTTGSVLWLYEDNETATQNLRREAQRRGVEAERLVFARRLPLDEHLARHQLADLFLDTLPYNAHTTASDALWAGLPVLTCTGSTFAGRVATSLLHAVGIPELATKSLQEYEALALQLTRDPSLLSSIKAKLTAHHEKLPLFDTKRLALHIERAYLTMWERFQSGSPPQGFTVQPID